MIDVFLSLICIASLVTFGSYICSSHNKSKYRSLRIERARLRREVVIVSNRYTKMKKHYETLRRKYVIVHSRYKRVKTKLYELVELHFGHDFVTDVIAKPTQRFIIDSASRESSPSTASTGSNDNIT
jgi:hypothetical protein